jgi:hypothetical protein
MKIEITPFCSIRKWIGFLISKLATAMGNDFLDLKKYTG